MSSESPAGAGAALAEALAHGPVTPLQPSEHPAARAWAGLRPRGARPSAVERLQKKPKGQAYRLRGAGPGGTNVIAKCSTAERIAGERAVYEQVLPALPVSVVRYYGCVDEPHGIGCWLFVEDAGGEAYLPHCGRHRALAGQWLALLHTSAAKTGMPRAAFEPDRRPGYYLGRLRSGRSTLASHMSNPALNPDDVELVRDVVRQCEITEGQWDAVEQWCAAMPTTFVHGDFAPKNMRVRPFPAGDVLLPYDWGSAGFGTAALDLPQAGTTAAGDGWDYWAHADLDAYLAVARAAWPGLSRQDVRMLALAGKVLRTLVCVCLEAPSFACDCVANAVRDMRYYRAAMADAIRTAGWGE
jgi:hypothetical protein